MKPSVSWLFISSALLSFSLGLSAQAAEVDLTESFDGAGGETFTPKETSDANGTTYILLNDISIISAGSTATPLSESCFDDTAGDLSFLGQGHSFIFDTINAGNNPAAIKTNTSKNITLSGFEQLALKSAPASSVTTGAGAVTAGGSLTINDTDYLVVLNNFSTNEGGAFKANDFTLSGISGNAKFQGNSSSKQGGAIYCTTILDITENSGSIIFTGNSAKETGGGAISTLASITITKNSSVSFSNNSATTTTPSTGTTAVAANGGAISCAPDSATTSTPSAPNPILRFEGNSSLSFTHNSADGSGGAIYAKNCYLISNGPTEFLFNKSGTTTTAGKGGAIAIAAGGSLVLIADKGDITFEGNTVVDATTTKRSAIDLLDGASIESLVASSGNSIYFYDPITSSTTPTAPVTPPTTTPTAPVSPTTTVTTGIFPTTPTGKPVITAASPTPTLTVPNELYLNAANEDGTMNTGSIIFSGEKLSATEKTADNTTSTISSLAHLSGGSLVLKEGVTVKFGGLTQDAQATVIMDAGTTLETTTEDISLTRVNINLDSLDGTKKATIKTSGTGKNATVSGPIGLVDKNGNFYESSALKDPQLFSLLEVIANGTGVASVSAIPALASEEPHFGYQGYWTLDWTTTSTTKSATVTWTKTGYTPSPEKNTALAPNSLWGNAIDLRSLHRLIKNHTQDTSLIESFWASGIANFYHQDQRSSRQGFRHLSGGSAFGANKIMPSEDLLSAAFCQFSGRDKDHVVTKNYSEVYGATLYYQHTATLFNVLNTFWGKAQTPPRMLSATPKDQHVVLNAHLTYTHADNHMKTDYSHHPLVHGSWRNNNFGVEVGAALASEALSSSWQISYSPFINAQYIYGRQQSFQERHSTEARSFEPSELINLAIPLGIRFERRSKITPSKQSLMFTYSVDAYRQNPDSITTLLASGDSWTTLGADPARQAVSAQVMNHFHFNQHLETFYQFAFEFRGSSRLYNFDIGTSFVF